MTFSAWMLILAVFLSGAVSGAFLILAIGIQMGDRARHLADEPVMRLDAVTRRVLGVGVRTDRPAGNSSTEGE